MSTCGDGNAATLDEEERRIIGLISVMGYFNEYQMRSFQCGKT